MNGTSNGQQPLEFTPAMSVVMVIVLAIGWLGWMGDQDKRAAMPRPRPVIQRVTDQAVQIPECSLTVSPPDGWTHLMIKNIIDDQPTFMNQTTQTIATFDSEPQADDAAGGNEIQYNHVSILWRPAIQEVGGVHLWEGWIQHPTAQARLRILTRAGNLSDDLSIATLCNAIRADD